ncbi:MAG: LTA synthase family protein [Agathobacter sp.]|nr:LTA synthase family protein [Lachnospiraceae bacterium]MDY2621126.1 LTA synthase family protein [Agathobacter sp.]
MPGILLYGNGMKVEFKIKLEYDKKNNIRAAIAIILAIVMYVTIGFHIGVLIAYGLLYYLIKSLKIDLDQRCPWLWTAILFVSGAIFTTFSIQYMLLDSELFQRMSDLKWVLNVLCCLVVYLVVQLFTNNAGLSCIISHTSLLSFAFINYFVYLFRGNEFTFSDIRSIGTGLSVAGNYKLQLNDRGAYAIFGAALFIAFVRKCHVKFARAWQMRIIDAMLAAICVIIVGMAAYDVNTETWEQKGTYRNGYILNYILGIRDSFIAQPDGYSEEAIQKLEKKYSSNDKDYSKTDVKDPTIIVIMNESFSDLSVLGDLQTNIPLTPFIDSLKENTTKGYALSSVFGAKTPNSEWEYLTGNSMAFLPAGSVVYQQYISDTPTSIVSNLKDDGYTCVAMHPYYATGWSRNQVYPKIGYDEMHFIDDFDQTKILREYITDQELYDKIIERYESRGANEKLYLMGITMQNHGGYGEPYDNFNEECYKIGRSYTDANQYLSLVHESDKAVKNFIEYFSKVDDPVEIVFFGDHQPSLNSNFYPLLNGKGMSGLTEDELEALYTVPFFIWTNYDTPEETVDITSLNFLSTMTLERAGIELPAYNKVLADMMETVPAINSRGYYSKEKQCYQHIDDATGEEAEWIKNYHMLQYNSMFDKKGRSNLFFPYNIGK